MTHRAPLRTPVQSRRSPVQQQVINNLLLTTLATPAAKPFYNAYFDNPPRRKDEMGKHSYVNFTYETTIAAAPFVPFVESFRHVKKPTQQPQQTQNLLQGTLYSAPEVPLIRLHDQPNPTRRGKTQQLQTWQPLQLTTLAAAGDTTPDQFGFTNQSGVALSSTITSASTQITGIDTTVSFAATGGTIDVNEDGNFQTSRDVVNLDVIRARHTSSANYDTLTQTVVTGGGVSATFTSRTLVDPDLIGYYSLMAFAKARRGRR